MIGVNRFNELAAHLVAVIPELKHAIVAVREEHFKEKVKDLGSDKVPLLLAVIPSADGEGDHDNHGDRDNFLMFVLTKRERSDRTDATELADYATTQSAMLGIKHKLIEIAGDCDAAFHQELKRLVVNSFHFDPEYNFLGYDGWSFTFVCRDTPL